MSNEKGNDSKAGEDHTSADPAVPEDSAQQSAAAETDKTPAEKKSHKGLWAFILLALSGISALVFYSDRLTELLPSRSHMPTPPPVLQPVSPEPKAAVIPRRPVIPPKPIATPRPANKPGVSSQEVKQMLSAMDNLRAELNQLSQDQRSMRAALKEQQQMNLQVRLRWITDPAARLPQIQLAWEEISLLPELSDAQRSEAERMHQLARSSVERLYQWQLAIRKWADMLVVPTHKDILPQPAHPWLAWIVGQFHLRQAPSLEARKLTDLRERLLETGHLLILESWPDQGEWQGLRARLLLEIRGHQGDTASPVELGLPDDFSTIQKDIQTLRDTARNWPGQPS